MMNIVLMNTFDKVIVVVIIITMSLSLSLTLQFIYINGIFSVLIIFGVLSDTSAL